MSFAEEYARLAIAIERKPEKKRLKRKKKYISDFLTLRSDFSDFVFSDIQKTPAIQWKMRNLEALRKSSMRKFELQVEKFEECF